MDDIGAMQQYGDLAMANKISRQTSERIHPIVIKTINHQPTRSGEHSTTIVEDSSELLRH